MTTGIELNRASLILAVLEKRVGLNISGHDVYLNIAGGMKVQEPALDLAIAIAVASSLKNQPCPVGLAVMGEVGLTGEIRGVSHLQKRLQEAKKLGFSQCVVPYGIKHEKVTDIEVVEVRTLNEALKVTMS
jgi:DNA repair protein RadA/Sms